MSYIVITMTTLAECMKGSGKTSAKDLTLLELYKASDSVSRVARNEGYEVITIDNKHRFNPLIRKHITEIDYSKHPDIPKKIDFIWASPPSDTYSTSVYPHKGRDTESAQPISDKAKEETKVLHTILDVIEHFKKENPKLKYCIQAPRGMMRKDKRMDALPYMATTYYCYYDDEKLKATDFWSNYPLDLIPITKKCDKYIGLETINDEVKRNTIPSKLIKEILDASRK